MRIRLEGTFLEELEMFDLKRSLSTISGIVAFLKRDSEDGEDARYPALARLAEDVAGGLMVTMPSQKDFHSETVVGRNGETIGEICNKFFATREGVST